jgi:hypothetical protein
MAVLWQLNVPDRFDSYSAGVTLLQMCLPPLRTDNNLIAFRRILEENGESLTKWRRGPLHSAPVHAHRPPHNVPVHATSSTAQCTGARHVVHHIVYRCTPRRPPHSVPVHATLSTT